MRLGDDSSSNSADNMASIQNEPPNICTDDFFSQTGEYCGEIASATLKRLPLWGEKVSDDEIDFEWPTPETFAEMKPDVSIKSMEFKTRNENSFYVSSVKVNLSNG